MKSSKLIEFLSDSDNSVLLFDTMFLEFYQTIASTILKWWILIKFCIFFRIMEAISSRNLQSSYYFTLK